MCTKAISYIIHVAALVRYASQRGLRKSRSARALSVTLQSNGTVCGALPRRHGGGRGGCQRRGGRPKCLRGRDHRLHPRPRHRHSQTRSATFQIVRPRRWHTSPKTASATVPAPSQWRESRNAQHRLGGRHDQSEYDDRAVGGPLRGGESLQRRRSDPSATSSVRSLPARTALHARPWPKVACKARPGFRPSLKPAEVKMSPIDAARSVCHRRSVIRVGRPCLITDL